MLAKLNSAVRTIHDRTGLSSQEALIRLRTLYATGLTLKQALAKVLTEEKKGRRKK